jgi:hypothetical protein
VEELFKVCAVEDTVRGGLGVVDDELVLGGGGLLDGGARLGEGHQPTETGTQQSGYHLDGGGGWGAALGAVAFVYAANRV